MKKLAAFFMSVIIVCSFWTADTAAAEAGSQNDIAILYTNDVHTYIDNPLSYDVLASLKAQLEKEYAHVLLVDAGDHIQGTAYGSMDKGKTILSLMNAAGYDLATLGNHEFDYGMEGCMNAIKWAEFPYVSCNFYEEENGVRGKNVLDSYALFSCGKETVAIVGITTPNSFTKSTPAYFQDEVGNYIYGISGGDTGEALKQDIQKAIDEAKAEGATKVIALGHLGDDPSSKPWTSEETISGLSGLDAFIDGHSHSTVEGKLIKDKEGQEVLLTQTGYYFNAVGLMIINGDTGEISTELIEAAEILQDVVDEKGEPVLDDEGKPETEVAGYEISSRLAPYLSYEADKKVQEIKEKWLAEIDGKLGTVIGSAKLTLDNYDGETRLVRSQETNTGDFCADALYYLFDNMDMAVDVAIMNGGGIRNKAITGDISYKICKDIHTFGNVACLQTVSGQQLLDALEWGARTAGTGEESGGFLQVSGITYSIDTQWPESTQQDDKGVWIGSPTGGYRVHNVKVYNKETNTYEDLDLTAKYNLAGYNYTLRNLGDGFNMFYDAINVLDYVMEDYMVLANYVQAFEGGVIAGTNSPLLEKYPGFLLDYSTVDGSGRITMVAAQRMGETEAMTATQETENGAVEEGAKAEAAEKSNSSSTILILIGILLILAAVVIVRNKQKKG